MLSLRWKNADIPRLHDNHLILNPQSAGAVADHGNFKKGVLVRNGCKLSGMPGERNGLVCGKNIGIADAAAGNADCGSLGTPQRNTGFIQGHGLAILLIPLVKRRPGIQLVIRKFK